MTETGAYINKMFRWLKDRRKSKGDKKCHKPEDDYGFKKKHVILQETENGHSVIVKDDQTTLVYPPSFCRFHFRARMPTPVQNVRETSIHIYDEIPESPFHTLELSSDRVEADVIKDARRASEEHMSLKNAIEVGPYLIVPIISCHSIDDGHVFELNKSEITAMFSSCLCDKISSMCTCNDLGNRLPNTFDMVKDTKVVLTRCVKSKSELRAVTNFQFLCSHNNGCSENVCSFSNGAHCSECASQTVLDQSALTFTGDHPTRLSDTFLKRSDPCAINSNGSEPVTETVNDNSHSCLDFKNNTDTCLFLKDNNDTCMDLKNENGTCMDLKNENGTCMDLKNENGTCMDLKNENGTCMDLKNENGTCMDLKNENGTCMDLKNENGTCMDLKNENGTCGEYDLSSAAISNKPPKIDVADYQAYLSKIETNLQLKDNVRQMIRQTESASCQHGEGELCDGDDSITYVSSLSEYSSAASHISDISADDNSTSDQSSGYYECIDDITGARDQTRVNLARSVSAPETSQSPLLHIEKCNKLKNKLTIKSKSFYDQRCKLFHANVYKALSDKDKELYMFPAASVAQSSTSLRNTRSKPVLPPQPTPMYMDPYRGKSRSHNRLLGDLIRMNYDKQLFFH